MIACTNLITTCDEWHAHTIVHVLIFSLHMCIHMCACMSIPVQDNNGVERTFGDCAVRKKYSHIDLIHMIDGVETQKATICAGNRCYYLKVCTVYITTSILLRVHIVRVWF